jgi:ABC-type phosphate transport system substrate-binding protein
MKVMQSEQVSLRRRPFPGAVALGLLLGLSVVAAARVRADTELTNQEEATKLVDSHFDSVGKRAHKQFYDPKRWDLSDLPTYKPDVQVSGVIKIGLAAYLRKGTVLTQWQDAFKKVQPGVKFEDSDYALSTGLVDLVQQRGFDFGEWQQSMFEQGVFPLEVEMATGAYDVPGWTPALTIFVNESNPIKGLTIKQLDGIFGGPRDGGFKRLSWDTSVARGREGNIRTWGKVGLTGEWAKHEIVTNGRPLKYHIQLYFERKVFGGGSMWNENIHEWPHVLQADGTRKLSSVSMVGAVAKDPYGIVYADMGSMMKGVKRLPIALDDRHPMVEMSLDTLHDRSYPLYMEIYLYALRQKGQPLKPAVREFLKFVLSREGQQAVANDAKWIPLPKKVLAEQLVKVEGATHVE